MVPEGCNKFRHIFLGCIYKSQKGWVISFQSRHTRFFIDLSFGFSFTTGTDKEITCQQGQ